MEAQRNRGLCNLSKFAATTIIRRLTQSGEWEALDVKEIFATQDRQREHVAPKALEEQAQQRGHHWCIARQL